MMNTKLRIALLATAAFAFTGSAAAQGRYGYPDNRGYGYGYGNGYARPDTRFHADPVSNAMRDLDSIFRRARVDHHEAGHFRNALSDLERFRYNSSGGRFDRRALDNAIDNMKDLARAHQLHPRDREIIARDINDLRYLRDRGSFNGYDRGYGYRPY